MSDDPWTFFGQFSKTDIQNASRLLSEAGIVFEVKEDPNWKPNSGWSGPHCLWIKDESTEKATALLVPFFASEKSN